MKTGFSVTAIHDHEFERIQTLVYRYFGIRLSQEKRALVVGRLQNLIRKKGLTSFDSYIDLVESDASGHELTGLIDRISTNHTYFFRAKEQFDFFMSTVLPDIEQRCLQEREKNVRLWCAGCSGGDEAYSFMICLFEYFAQDYTSWNAGILATDISQRMIEEGRNGVYSEKRIEHVPQIIRKKYFQKIEKEQYEIIETLKREVTFRRLNLKNDCFPFKQTFDLISCRNVMIYFSHDMKSKLVRHLYDLIRPGGYMFIGNSESLDRRMVPFRYVMPGIYRKVG